MAFTSTLTKRVDLPHEPGQWIEVRQPSFSVIFEAQRSHDDDAALMGVTVAKACIVAWSYDVPVTPESIDDLDFETFQVVLGAVARMMPGAVEPGESADGADPAKKGSGRSRTR